ncbi:MAG: ABC transporter ATP-binding protein [Planctomycetota bacterium]|nr:ABC transporter ATP-binding protein [Planctomycetota bacterium]MDP7130806.1 ABC transporter ATP-binding protein [Planctomycetota bacterium]MDP7249781.1 ABC transporter ATP-binding protein [Planctomycetota bacterium]
MSAESVLIELRDFSFSFGERRVLEDISMSIGKGEFVCIIGPNGAGKTTLIKCLNRIWRGGSGGISIAGKPLNHYSQGELARLLAYVPQADGRTAPFTVYEFVMMGRYPYLDAFSSIRSEDDKVIRKAMETTGTSDFAERFFDTLSGGERQKVFLAAALAQQGSMLLLDEPTTFLDPRHQIEINRTLKRVNQEDGVTILSATHDINSGLGIAERIIALKAGKIIFDGPGDVLAGTNVLRDLYDHDFLITQHPKTGKPMILPEED